LDEKPILQIQLNPNGVSTPAQRAVVIASQVVAIALRALAKDDLSEPEMQSGFMGYRFNGIDWSDEERRQTFENWILSKGFQDLARGVRETLEEAAFYLDMIGVDSGITTVDEINRKIGSFRKKAASLKFPDLLGRVNKRLTEPLAFEAEFLSLQRVRNCLEHRGGRVGPKDIDPTSATMVLTFPRLRTFICAKVGKSKLRPEKLSTRRMWTGMARQKEASQFTWVGPLDVLNISLAIQL